MTTTVVVRKAGQIAIASDSLVTFGEVRLTGESNPAAAELPILNQLAVNPRGACTMTDEPLADIGR